MPQATFSVRMNDKLKREFDTLCADFGMNATTAINVFAKAVVCERKIPFEIVASEPVVSLKDGRKAFWELRKVSVYASFDDVVKFVSEKYSLGEIHNFSVQANCFGGYKINHEGNRYFVTAKETKQLEREHITESVYCNEFKYCSMSWFYSSIGDELLPEYMAVVDDELIQKASVLLGYESEKILGKGLADVIDGEADAEDRFIASLIMAKEIAGRVNGRAVLWYD